MERQANVAGIEAEIMKRKWFYHFVLPNGQVTELYVPESVATLHNARLSMLDEFLDRTFGPDLSQLRVLDVACHEGFFTSHLARRGCAEVVGIDVRTENIEVANLIKDVYELGNMKLLVQDVFDLTLEPQRIGERSGIQRFR